LTPARSPRATLEALFAAALSAVDPATAVARSIVGAPGVHGPLSVAGVPFGPECRFVVLAAGKAACSMAGALEERLGERIARGLAVTKDGHALPLRTLTVIEAAHPVPDPRCERAAAEALALARSVGPEEAFLVLLSGGASALLTAPPPGLRQEDLAHTTAALLAQGADIQELNCVRKHLGTVSGGRLASQARGASIVELVVSDVIGDPLDVIGSGPCSADPTTYADALAILTRRGLREQLPERVLAHLEAGVQGKLPETAKPGDPALRRVVARVVSGNLDALEAARNEAERKGLRAIVASGRLRGEARVAGRRLAALSRALDVDAPVVVLAGGETTVTVRGPGRGGRNQELALSAALELQDLPRTALLAAGTDGSDGPTDAAGAFVDAGTVARGRALGLTAEQALLENDSYPFFLKEGGTFRTGPTRTNVMDLVFLMREWAPGESSTGIRR
jgi:hydroxypyruvate reductase